MQCVLIAATASLLWRPVYFEASPTIVLSSSDIVTGSLSRLVDADSNTIDLDAASASEAIRYVARWVLRSMNNRALPFILVDKIDAKIYVFGSDGRLVGASPVLLGAAHGDHSVPGIGQRKIADILPAERTTPAGRFIAEFGRNLNGEDIVWVDYDAAISMHRVRATNPLEQRLERLDSPTAEDNRVSYGCINVPREFYDEVVRRTLSKSIGTNKAIVYILPELQSVQQTFGQ